MAASAASGKTTAGSSMGGGEQVSSSVEDEEEEKMDSVGSTTGDNGGLRSCFRLVDSESGSCGRSSAATSSPTSDESSSPVDELSVLEASSSLLASLS